MSTLENATGENSAYYVPTAFRLLDLPTELRIIIYELVVQDFITDTLQKHYRYTIRDEQRNIDTHGLVDIRQHLCVSEQCYNFLSPQDLNLRKVCKAVSAELEPIFVRLLKEEIERLTWNLFRLREAKDIDIRRFRATPLSYADFTNKWVAKIGQLECEVVAFGILLDGQDQRMDLLRRYHEHVSEMKPGEEDMTDEELRKKQAAFLEEIEASM